MGGEREQQPRNEEREQYISLGQRLRGVGRKMKEEAAICFESCTWIALQGLGRSRVASSPRESLRWEEPALSPGVARTNPNSREGGQVNSGINALWRGPQRGSHFLCTPTLCSTGMSLISEMGKPIFGEAKSLSQVP